jgi:FHA domain
VFILQLQIQGRTMREIRGRILLPPSSNNPCSSSSSCLQRLKINSPDEAPLLATHPMSEGGGSMHLSIILHSPRKMRGQAIPIRGPKFFIGSDPDCHLQPFSRSVSGHHCALLVRDHSVCVHDLASASGTFVNGQRVTTDVQLQDGDEVQAGRLVFEVHLEQSAIAMPAYQDSARPRPAARARAIGPADHEKEENSSARDSSAIARELLQKYFRPPNH